MAKAKVKTWGDEFQRHLSNGCDHADVAYRADEWERLRKIKRWSRGGI